MTGADQIVTIDTEAELRELIGEPVARAVTKERTALTDTDRAWLAASPFCLVATSDAEGNCDVSPKGDPPGIATVLDDTTIALPERPGNRRADGYRNILANPHVGLEFLIPGRGDSLRVNGRATLVRDAPFFDDMIVRGHRPILAIVVDIEQIFFHCPKAFLRAKLWDPESWRPDAMPPHAHIVKAVQDTPETLEQLVEHYGPRYREKLYG
ncbi:hypothetical protein LX16_2046 [Stackebrandtia albiflava]|uniref:Pyridoxamine 5'-phosphate oxidase N-terminal domain-containing protein n=1 Tax=Stackebrandtia albiflava TaxID=406432 RepID=A0A562VES3_9ACTN|nr:pyridoxamine 5'-phosphate oxidase family protein [Stackebrandtia albiflava]TWJ16317.1 hypothetical protein LX16_2046 [Stackebrandtia albiflava]